MALVAMRDSARSEVADFPLNIAGLDYEKGSLRDVRVKGTLSSHQLRTALFDAAPAPAPPAPPEDPIAVAPGDTLGAALLVAVAPVPGPPGEHGDEGTYFSET